MIVPTLIVGGVKERRVQAVIPALCTPPLADMDPERGRGLQLGSLPIPGPADGAKGLVKFGLSMLTALFLWSQPCFCGYYVWDLVANTFPHICTQIWHVYMRFHAVQIKCMFCFSLHLLTHSHILMHSCMHMRHACSPTCLSYLCRYLIHLCVLIDLFEICTSCVFMACLS